MRIQITTGKKSQVLKWGSLLSILTTLSIDISAREWTSIFNSPRGMMLGNAMTAKVNDYSALFYNPAGLAAVETWRIQFPLDVNIAMSSNFLTFIKTDLPGLQTAINSASTGSATGIKDFVNYGARFIGRSYVADLNYIPLGLTFKNFAINLIAGNNVSVRFLPSQLPAIEVNNRAQAGLNLGYAMSFFDNILRVGLAGHLLARFGLSSNVGFSNGISFSGGSDALKNMLDPNTLLKKAETGVGYDFDLGTQVVLPLPQIPLVSLGTKIKFGAVLQNILNSDFIPISGVGVGTKITKESPYALERTLNLGTAWEIAPVFGFWRNEVSFDIRNLLRGSYSRSIGTNFNLGFESMFDFKSWLQLTARVGVNDGAYMTYGAMLRLFFLTLEGGVYSTELGGYPGQQASQRFIARVAFEI